ncbi:MAG: hypothetical protein CMQ24_19080 [Gammaproteobacteria bacterium]|nr:hypothetical protein [Gammaproteobacteria bacterium]|tara:strand:- start:31 stop:486 length:456 start_codon:yes stop_codon:yes gene_type:complete
MQRYLPWIPPIFVTFVFVQSLFFKFSGSEETVIIFNTIADWMAGLPLLAAIAKPFGTYGGNVVGFTELVAAVLILVPRTRFYGALLGFGVISGAIFFHLFSPLGVVRVVDAAGNTDGGALFAMACGVWISCVITLVLESRGRSAEPVPLTA